jgi:hypothetical protein
LIRYEEGRKKVRTVWYNAISVRLPKRGEWLFMVAARGFGQELMMLLSFFGVPSFFNYAIADGLHNLLFPDKRGLNLKGNRTQVFQLCFSFW